MRSLDKRQLHPVLGADTVVVVEGAMLGKPRDRAEGLAMLARLSGRASGVERCGAGNPEARCGQSPGKPGPLPCVVAVECAAYWETGEPCDKAGDAAIQGQAAAFITEFMAASPGSWVCRCLKLPNCCGSSALPTKGTEPYGYPHRRRHWRRHPD